MSINVPFARTHFDSALALFRQRQGMLDRLESDAVALARLEQRLRLHLHVLARCGDQWPEPKKAPEVFVWLAAGLSSPDDSLAQQSRLQGLDWLAEKGARGEGAFAALSLFPPPEQAAYSFDLYRVQVPLRPLLFQLWREQGVRVPAAMLNQADLQGDPDLRQAALAYAAERPEVGLEMFQAAYRPLLAGRPLTDPPAGLWAVALRGGLLRADPVAPKALRRAIEHCSDSAERQELLRLAALSGDAALYPVLQRHFENHPGPGSLLLALHGSAQVVDDLMAALSRPAVAAEVADGWQRLTGVRLVQRPHLQIAGGTTSSIDGMRMVPDREEAQRWWQDNPRQERLLFGLPHSPTALMNHLERRAGVVRRDLLDLLTIQQGCPFGFTSRTWLADQRLGLQAILGAAGEKLTTARPSGA